MSHPSTAGTPPFEPNGIVTLTTDFGTHDGYVGAMKGVLLSRFASARIVDMTHDVPPHDLGAAAQALADACPFFPPGTVHTAVVDPGVGTSRAPIVALHGGQAYVGPDNGLFSRVLPENAPAYRIERADLRLAKVSQTFHGRDIFAPTAAALASGVLLPDQVGPPIALQRLPAPTFQRGAGHLRGEVIAIDRFGNLITNIPATELTSEFCFGSVRVTVRDVTVRGIAWSYADVPVGEWLAIIGSRDTVELSIREGNAALDAGIHTGERVEVAC